MSARLAAPGYRLRLDVGKQWRQDVEAVALYVELDRLA